MNKRELILAVGILAALAWTQTSATAQTVDVSGVGGGNTSASTGGTGGTSGSVSTAGGGALGGSGPTTANATLGGGGTGPATADATIGNGTIAGNPNGQAVVNTGPAAGNGASTAVLTLNGVDAQGNPTGSLVVGSGSNPANGGTTNTIVLNPNGTIAGADTNGDGVADTAIDDRQVQTALASLDDSELAKFKRKCADVLGNPTAFDQATVAVCAVLATI